MKVCSFLAKNDKKSTNLGQLIGHFLLKPGKKLKVTSKQPLNIFLAFLILLISARVFKIFVDLISTYPFRTVKGVISLGIDNQMQFNDHVI
mmetsp:Transcript_31731/g.46273  ORF Transcript_31731/g.46273 Transcript_31731/m.46273 type:complete len:91 (-) Transcript_31731:64-336(-)